ncbi:hypothetical protein [Methanobrevibacter sp.]|uniref:hypothetical protein n=1 Tax=Methanobrevibacter sp. TaxID=66852 RepID=UPI002606AADB|nr:hypothetical protein [uncultured Methanobrevibacter sp.]
MKKINRNKYYEIKDLHMNRINVPILPHINKTHKEKYRIYREKYNNDKKIKGGKKGKCILCQKETKLQLSHIVPKWCYKPLKEKNSKFIVGNYESLGLFVKEQDGNKHYLLCKDCEQYLGESENYIKKLTDYYNKKEEIINQKEGRIEEKNLNFELIQRFVFGLTIKSNYATSIPFNYINLKSYIIHLLRKKVLSPSTDDKTFPIIAHKFFSKLEPEIRSNGMIIPEYNETEIGQPVISYLMAGWEWTIFLYPDVDPIVTDVSLKNNGSLNILVLDITNQRFINPDICAGCDKNCTLD